MDIYAIERFCDRWIDKAAAYEADSLEDLFDRFFTLFVAYNRLYSAGAELYRGTLEPRQALMFQGDRKEATTVMAKLIGRARFLSVSQGCTEVADACVTIAELVQSRQLFLHSVRGTEEPDFERDARLAVDLRRHDLMAALQCLYQIRCNIFHGEKEFAPWQAQLLVPAIALLEVVVRLSKDALHRTVTKMACMDEDKDGNP